MTVSIALVLLVLGFAILLFVTEWVSVDVVALLVLISLALTGLISHTQALSGFSNPAVVTIAAVLVLSGGLIRTGVAHWIGLQILRLVGESELQLLVVIMSTAGFLSGIMNNIAVLAMMLPVVLDLARRLGRSPSKLLMPLAFSSLLGGLTTLIGTSSNILISGALNDKGLAAFELLDFTPLGVIVLFLGIVYLVLIGRHLLPERGLARNSSSRTGKDLKGVYDFRKHFFSLSLPQRSTLSGRSLEASRLGLVLGFNVLAIVRDSRTVLAPAPDSILRSGDKLLVEGQLEELNALQGWKHFILESGRLVSEKLVSSAVDFAELKVDRESNLTGRTLVESRFRQCFQVHVLGIKRDGEIRFSKLLEVPLETGDTLLVVGRSKQVQSLREEKTFTSFQSLTTREVALRYKLHRQLIGLCVPQDSFLSGRTLAASRLGDAFDLTVLGVIRDNETHFMPGPEEELRAEDTLLVQGNSEDLSTLHALQNLEVDRQVQPGIEELESGTVGVGEVMLSPRTTLAGMTLGEMYFREKNGLTVVALWRECRAYQSNLRDIQVRFGDVLLVYGKREKLAMLGREPDFLVLTEAVREVFRDHKLTLAAMIELGVLGSVFLGWLPIHIASTSGAVLMILTGCLTVEEAYRFIEWKAVVLIGGMLSLGLAMQETGAANVLATSVLGSLGSLGPVAVLAGLFLITALSAQVIPTAVVAVLMSPIALNSASDLGLSPHALMMAVAVACSSSLLSPVGHPVNLLVMGPGGYRFTDYLKVGFPLLVLILIVVLVALPILWPLSSR